MMGERAGGKREREKCVVSCSDGPHASNRTACTDISFISLPFGGLFAFFFSVGGNVIAIIATVNGIINPTIHRCDRENGGDDDSGDAATNYKNSTLVDLWSKLLKRFNAN